jgi:hypothetical protein
MISSLFFDRRLVLDHHTNYQTKPADTLDWIGLRKLLALVTRSYLCLGLGARPVGVRLTKQTERSVLD